MLRNRESSPDWNISIAKLVPYGSSWATHLDVARHSWLVILHLHCFYYAYLKCMGARMNCRFTSMSWSVYVLPSLACANELGRFFQPTGWNWQKSQGSTLFEHYWNPLFIDDFWELYQQSNREIPIDHQVLMPNLVVYLCRLSRQGWIQDGHDPVGNLMLLQPLVKHLMFFSRNRETPWSLGTAF